jgi:predicted O-methyltransferase YrrM
MIYKLKKLFSLLSSLKSKKENYLKYQSIIFDKYNLDRRIGENLLNKITLENTFLNSAMNSEHQIIFSSFSNQKKNIKKILEIGTYDGKNAFLLSKLYPDTKITTIDLPDENKKFETYYERNRNPKFSNFIEKRDKLIESCNNVTFKKINSINLLFEEEKFDIIWIDGAHGYPFVTIDIINALRLCNHEGIIMCDDVIKHKVKNPDEMYYSNASLETLKLLADEKILFFDLFLKRLEKKYNYFLPEQKFIAIIKKIKKF